MTYRMQKRFVVHQPFFLLLLTAGLFTSLASITLAEQDWGGLRGIIELRGQPPQLAEPDPGNDDFCCQANPQNESLVLGENLGIANVVVYLRPRRGAVLPVHPDHAAAMKAPVDLDNKGCAFVPHVVLLQTGQVLQLRNTDSVNHSIKSELGDEAFNFMLSAGGTQELTFEAAQRLPRPVECSIHPFMRGWLLVRDDPYMAKSQADGRFEIRQLPAGEHEIQFWHERPGYLKNCQSENIVLDRRGRATITIEPNGVTDLGTIEVAATLMAGEGG